MEPPLAACVSPRRESADHSKRPPYDPHRPLLGAGQSPALAGRGRRPPRDVQRPPRVAHLARTRAQQDDGRHGQALRGSLSRARALVAERRSNGPALRAHERGQAPRPRHRRSIFIGAVVQRLGAGGKTRALDAMHRPANRATGIVAATRRVATSRSDSHVLKRLTSRGCDSAGGQITSARIRTSSAVFSPFRGVRPAPGPTVAASSTLRRRP